MNIVIIPTMLVIIRIKQKNIKKSYNKINVFCLVTNFNENNENKDNR